MPPLPPCDLLLWAGGVPARGTEGPDLRVVDVQGRPPTVAEGRLIDLDAVAF